MVEDFYPTPKSLISKMLKGIDFHDVSDVLEPSAGKGDICDAIKDKLRNGSKIDVIELNLDLQATLRGKGYNLICDDFLEFDTFKVYDLLIANFPFSEGDRHLSHALDLLHRNGGNMVCLVNAETIKNPYTNLRKMVVKTLNEAGASIEYLAQEFAYAERRTNVDVALIRVSIEKPVAPSLILDTLKKSKEATEDTVKFSTQIIDKNFMKALVNRYTVEAEVGIKLIEEWFALSPYLTDRLKKGNDDDKYSNPILELKVEGAYGTKASYINAYLRGLRQKFWELLINDPRFNSSYTTNILTQLNSKLNDLRECDFSLFNIQQLETELRQKIVVGIEKSILDLFDDLSGKHAWHQDIDNGNIHYYNGWKTNRAHKINSKVIIPFYAFSRYTFSSDRIDYDAQRRLIDIVKVFNYLAGTLEDAALLAGQTIATATTSQNFSGLDMRYFDITIYKKGTAHIRFKDQSLLDKFNIYGSRKKGWLPPSYGKRTYQEMDQEERAVVDEFQGEKAYDEVMRKKDFYLANDDKNLLLT